MGVFNPKKCEEFKKGNKKILCVIKIEDID